MERNKSPKDPRPARELRSRHQGAIDDAVINGGGEDRAQPAPALASPEEIAARAHEIYLARGAAPGGELDDWLQAERELCFPGLRD